MCIRSIKTGAGFGTEFGLHCVTRGEGGGAIDLGIYFGPALGLLF